jgi:hypothetical protein
MKVSLRVIISIFFDILLAAILPFLNECITLANCMTDIAVHGKGTANLGEDCRDLTKFCIDLYTNYQTGSLRKISLFIKIYFLYF